MNIIKKISFVLLPLIVILITSSCNNSDVTAPVDSGTLLFNSNGLVDSAVVYGCYSITRRYYIPDTLSLSNYSKLKFEFDGNTNSDGTITYVFLNTVNENNILCYRADNSEGINKIHTFETNKPDNMTWVEVRLYINPPVCGTNEFKYNRVRDLKIYGVK